VSKSDSLQRLISVQTPDWLLQAAQQIQVIDYELHAAIRIISKGQMEPEHVPTFMDACVKRDRLMARILTFLADQHKESVYGRRGEKPQDLK
jgi:hypothetical protein